MRSKRNEMRRKLTNLFDEQILLNATATRSIPLGALARSAELDDAFEFVLSDIAPNSSFYATMESIYDYMLRNNFITQGQWKTLRACLEKRGQYEAIDELEEQLRW